MRKILVVVAASIVVTACTVASDKPTNGDAARTYLAPALCEKIAFCNADFMFVYPGGRPECEKKLSDVTPDKDKLSNCDVDQWRKCSADTRTAGCPSDPARHGVPDLPPSCGGC